MKKIVILLIFLITLSSCVEDDNHVQLPTIGRIQLRAAEGFHEGKLIEFSIPLLNGLREDQVQIEWDFGDGASGFYQDTSHTYNQTGTYNISVIVSNDAGWDRSATSLTISPVYSDNPPRGSVIFWAKGTQITPPLSVITRGTEGRITRTFIQTPTCGDSGVAQWDNIPYGRYHFTAIDAAGVTWNGHYTVDQSCNGVKLLYSGNGNRSPRLVTTNYQEINLSL